jgi:hypothetical protein
MLAPDRESHLLHCGCSACYLVSVCRWFTVSPEPPDTVQVLEEVLPTYDFEAKRAKINGKRTRDYPRVPVRGPSAPPDVQAASPVRAAFTREAGQDKCVPGSDFVAQSLWCARCVT